ncbi:MAG: C-terminal binding protein [Pseudomonadota bacterium]
MHILIVDPQFEGPADIERTAAGPEPTITVWQTQQSGPVPTEVFAACDALINCRSRHPVTAEVVAKMTRCRIVAQAGVGFNHIDLEACTARGIPVCNTPDYGTTEVADHALALALDLTRGISAYDAKLRARTMGWDARAQKTVRRLKGATFGIVGLGRIGTAAALRARGFEMDIAFYDPDLRAGTERAFGFTRHESLEALLGASDIVSLHTPLTEETDGFINHQALAAAKPGLVLINTSRGRVCNLDAVEAALRSGQLGGAGLDVIPVEPIDYDHSLLKAFEANEDWLDGRLVITPHAAFFSPDSVRDMRRIATETVMNYLRNGITRSCINEAGLAARGARAAVA